MFTETEIVIQIMFTDAEMVYHTDHNVHTDAEIVIIQTMFTLTLRWLSYRPCSLGFGACGAGNETFASFSTEERHFNGRRLCE